MREPKVFLIGETKVHEAGLQAYLAHIGAPDWQSDAPGDVELLSEVMARSCYRSFGTELNPNVTRVRGSNKAHLANLIKVKHGSTLEHAWLNFMFCDVSRVVTHELVRHRAGTAVSQESLRFVRLTDDLDGYVPLVIRETPEAMELFCRTFDQLGALQMRLTDLLNVDDLPFSEKKKITSAMRRLAPIGLATNIGWSANIRAVRHVIEMRTAPGAEGRDQAAVRQGGGAMRRALSTPVRRLSSRRGGRLPLVPHRAPQGLGRYRTGGCWSEPRRKGRGYPEPRQVGTRCPLQHPLGVASRGRGPPWRYWQRRHAGRRVATPQTAVPGGAPKAIFYPGNQLQQRDRVGRTAADVVDLPLDPVNALDSPLVESQQIGDVQDVAHLFAVSVDGQWLAEHSGNTEPGHKALILHAKLPGTVDGALPQARRSGGRKCARSPRHTDRRRPWSSRRASESPRGRSSAMPSGQSR